MNHERNRESYGWITMWERPLVELKTFTLHADITCLQTTRSQGIQRTTNRKKAIHTQRQKATMGKCMLNVHQEK